MISLKKVKPDFILYRIWLILILNLVFIYSYINAQIPQTINYQGVLTNASGQIVPDNNYILTFSLYDAETGGTSLWQERHTVNIQNGVMNIVLGSVAPITLSFEKQYWLGIKIGDGSELTPRIQLTSNAYSLNSKSVIDNSITTNKIVDGAVTQNKLAPDLILPPGGTASGDLSGTYPNPIVTKIQGRDISNTTPLVSQVLKWNGTTWYPDNDNSGGSPSGYAGGDLSGAYPNPTVTRIQGKDVSSTSPTTNQVLKYNGTNWAPGTDNSGGAPSGSAGGDLYGTYPNPTVAKIQGKDISSTSPTTNQVLKYNGTSWVPGTDNSGGAPSGTAGGDLSGTYPNPMVVQIQGKDIAKTAPTSDQVLKWNGTAWTPSADATGIGGSGTANYIPLFSSASNLGNSVISQTTDGGIGVGGELSVSTTNQNAGYFSNNSISNATIYAVNNTTSEVFSSTAINGTCKPADGYGTGGSFTGGSCGLSGNAYGGSTSLIVKGVSGYANGTLDNVGSRYGVQGQASFGRDCIGVIGYASSGNICTGIVGSALGSAKNYGVEGYASGGTNNYAVYAAGDLVYTGALFHSSDIMLKENVKQLNGILPKLLQLETKTFSFSRNPEYESMNLSSGTHYGLTAQDIEKIFPDLVVDVVHPGKRNKDGEVGQEIHYKGVKTMELIPILIQAVKEQQVIIEELQRKVEQLSNK